MRVIRRGRITQVISMADCAHQAYTAEIDNGKAARCLNCGHRILDYRGGKWVMPRQTRYSPGRWFTELHRRKVARAW